MFMVIKLIVLDIVSVFVSLSNFMRKLFKEVLQIGG